MLSVSLPEFPNYIIYLDGRVYTTKRKMFIKKSIDKYGYENIQLSNGKMKNFKVHRLLAMCFFPHNENLDKIQIDHINRIRNDNRLENLRFADYDLQQKNSKRKKLPFGILPFIYIVIQKNKYKSYRFAVRYNNKQTFRQNKDLDTVIKYRDQYLRNNMGLLDKFEPSDKLDKLICYLVRL
jgi:hypothetical protein